MKSKLLSVILAACMVFALVACAGGTSAGDTTAAAADVPEEAAAAEPEAAEPEAAEPEAAEPETAEPETTEPAVDLAEASQILPLEYSGPTEQAGAPAQGIKIAAIASDGQLAGCVAPCDGVAAAAAAAGWESQYFDGGGNAATQNEMMLNAISWGADVIACIAIDPAAVQQGLQAAADAGVIVVSGSAGIDSPNDLPDGYSYEGLLNFEFDVSPDLHALSYATGEWVIKDAGDQGEVAVFCDNQFPSNVVAMNGFLAAIEESNMVASEPQYFNGSQIGDTLNRQLVSYLTEHPECQYVWSPYDPAAASMVEGLIQANMADIRLVSSLGIEQNLKFISEGKVQVADVAYDNNYMGWGIVDQTIRLMNEKPLFEPHGENIPYIVFDKNNLPAEGTNSNWSANSEWDYESIFPDLWK